MIKVTSLDRPHPSCSPTSNPTPRHFQVNLPFTPQPHSFLLPHTVERLEAPIPLHGGVGTKSKAVGTILVGQVIVLIGPAHNHTVVLAGCTEVSAGPRGQSQCWDRRGPQEMDHNGGRSAQFWIICIVGDDIVSEKMD